MVVSNISRKYGDKQGGEVGLAMFASNLLLLHCSIYVAYYITNKTKKSIDISIHSIQFMP